MKIDGQCHCGAVAYEADVDPERVTICHCTDCQTLSGTAFRTAVPAARAQFRLVRGTPRIYIKTAESGARRAQAFCADCGSPIYASAPDDPPFYMIRVGTARQRSQLVPKTQIWCRSAQAWLGELDGMRKVEMQPPPPAPAK